MTTTQSDRDHIRRLNGMSGIDKYPPWKKKATPIPPPKNPRPEMRLLQVGRNPYNRVLQETKPEQKQFPKVGNQTSSRTMIGADAPPAKRQKTDHSFDCGPETTSFSEPNDRKGKKRHKAENKEPEEFFMVEDSPNEHDDIPNLPRRSSSADELLLQSPNHAKDSPSVKSKYSFLSAHKSNSEYVDPPAGPDTQWVKKRYLRNSPPDESDPIESFSEPVPPPPGHVKAKIDAYDMNDRKVKETVQRIDLTKVPRKPLKEQMKRKSGQSIQDSIATAPTPFQHGASRAKKTQGGYNLPVKEVVLDDKHYTGEGITFLCNQDCNQNRNSFTIKTGQRVLVQPFDIRIYSQSMTSPDSDVSFPVLQLSQDGSKQRTSCPWKVITLKFDSESGTWSREAYYDILNWLKARINSKETVRPEAMRSLWEASLTGAVLQDGNNRDGSTLSRMAELAELQAKKAQSHKTDSELGSKRKRPCDEAPHSEATHLENAPQLRYTPDPFTLSKPNRTSSSSRKETQPNKPGPSQLRRSTRNVPPPKSEPLVDQDEVILVYPQGVPGAVNVTNGDLARLEPGEFLNDTIIEFGLKLWLKELQGSNPELASQIHVFNSFFYKKLNHKKDIDAGYESVRKWTSKFDIFQKKYIIVPINENLHWYLAIIYEPEHTLFPTLPETPSRRTRHSMAAADAKSAANLPLTEKILAKHSADQGSVPSSVIGEGDDKQTTGSEAEVERDLGGFQGSCTITHDDEDPKPREETDIHDGEKSDSVFSYVSIPHRPVHDGDKSDSALSYMSSPNAKVRPLSPTSLDRGHSSIIDEKMEIDSAEVESKAGSDSMVPASRFYQKLSRRDKGKNEAEPIPETIPMEVDDAVEVGDVTRTSIFIFDSLGSRHPQAIKKLGKYLQLEAKHKKGLDNASLATGKSALVPVQPNFCDCGVYLLHFAETFMRDPQTYSRSILTHRARNKPNSDRQTEWRDAEVADKRQALARRIRKLSVSWKEERKAKEEARKRDAGEKEIQEISSDSDGDEVRILTSTIPSPGKGKKKKKKQ